MPGSLTERQTRTRADMGRGNAAMLGGGRAREAVGDVQDALPGHVLGARVHRVLAQEQIERGARQPPAVPLAQHERAPVAQVARRHHCARRAARQRASTTNCLMDAQVTHVLDACIG